MPYITRRVVFEAEDKTFYEKVLVNDDGKELKCPLKRIALAASNPKGWGKNDIPSDADCTDNCPGFHTGCPFNEENMIHTYSMDEDDKSKRIKE